MKKNIILLICFLLIFSFKALGQKKLTSKEWINDLHYLKEIIHQSYSHLFYKVSATEFDNAVNRLKERIPYLQSHEIIVGFAELIALFGYGHTGINLFENRHGVSSNTNFSQTQVSFYKFSDGIFIQGASKEYERIVGAQVLGIGEKGIDEALEAIKSVVSIENEQYFYGFGLAFLSCPEILHAKKVIKNKDSVPLLLKKNGKEFSIVLKTQKNLHIPKQYGWVKPIDGWVTFRNPGAAPLWMKDLNRKYFFQYLKEKKTVYVRQSQMRDEVDEPIQEFYDRVLDFVENHPVEKLILDLRINDGGNSYKNKAIVLGLIRSKVNEKGKLIAIIGKQTYSATQNLVNTLERYTETTFIGEPTAENVNFYGDVRIEQLPLSKLNIRLSYLWHQEGNAGDKRQATYPEVTVEFSSQDYHLNRDPILKKALEYHSNIKEAMSKIRRLVNNRKWKLVEELVMEFKNDPENKYSNIRARLNTLGYEYLHRKEFKTAIKIFELNTHLFPKFPNCWDSLAESYWKSGQTEKAVICYQKAIDLNPNGPTAENARGMLRIIKAHR